MMSKALSSFSSLPEALSSSFSSLPREISIVITDFAIAIISNHDDDNDDSLNAVSFYGSGDAGEEEDGDCDDAVSFYDCGDTGEEEDGEEIELPLNPYRFESSSPSSTFVLCDDNSVDKNDEDVTLMTKRRSVPDSLASTWKYKSGVRRRSSDIEYDGTRWSGLPVCDGLDDIHKDTTPNERKGKRESVTSIPSLASFTSFSSMASMDLPPVQPLRNESGHDAQPVRNGETWARTTSNPSRTSSFTSFSSTASSMDCPPIRPMRRSSRTGAGVGPAVADSTSAAAAAAAAEPIYGGRRRSSSSMHNATWDSTAHSTDTTTKYSSASSIDGSDVIPSSTVHSTDDTTTKYSTATSIDSLQCYISTSD